MTHVLVFAIGYEGAISIGGLSTALTVISCAVLATWLLARWLVGRFSRR